ncbi:1,4-alpha-glucan (glycogen) branching enzyme, GH-13-type, partial [hydrothermal vent metagenome]
MANVIAHSFFTDFDINLFKSGKHFRLYEKFGAHAIELNGELGVYFSVWAPTAKSVSVIGDFNFWNDKQHK